MKVAIIGGGAAGFFAAVNIKMFAPKLEVTIYEKSVKVLAKVAVSGGGRCNLTNSFRLVRDLSKVYPRGAKLMKQSFRVFNHNDVYDWFEDNGVPLVIQDDECVFPQSQDSLSVVNCLVSLSRELDVKVKTSHNLLSIKKGECYSLHFSHDEVVKADIVLITTGGNPRVDGFDYLRELGHQIAAPTASLFTFNIPSDPVRELMGNVIEDSIISLQGTKIKASGALLITHWGMSGPAILKLSSYAARIANERNYSFNIAVNWVGEPSCEEIERHLAIMVDQNPKKQLSNLRPFDLPSRVWLFLLEKIEISGERRWCEMGRKSINKIINILSNDVYSVHGKGRFRDEFVTCGGVSLDSIDPSTMASLHAENMFFAGEVLDIDAITGGFNLQAAWTTAYVAAKAICDKTL